MPGRPTKDTVAVNLELPAALVEDLREFARKDMRSIKSEVIRALHLLLYDQPEADTIRMSGTSPVDTMQTEIPTSESETAAQKATSVMVNWDANTFDAFLSRQLLPKRKPRLTDIAVRLKLGKTKEEILAEYPKERKLVELQIQNVEKWAEGFQP